MGRVAESPERGGRERAGALQLAQQAGGFGGGGLGAPGQLTARADRAGVVVQGDAPAGGEPRAGVGGEPWVHGRDYASALPTGVALRGAGGPSRHHGRNRGGVGRLSRRGLGWGSRASCGRGYAGGDDDGAGGDDDHSGMGGGGG